MCTEGLCHRCRLTALANDSLDLVSHREVGPEALVDGVLADEHGSLVGAVHCRRAEDEPPNEQAIEHLVEKRYGTRSRWHQ
eukprot:SAG25_NODE_1221_length_3571_cov_1.954781_2_plen_81_part_00